MRSGSCPQCPRSEPRGRRFVWSFVFALGAMVLLGLLPANAVARAMPAREMGMAQAGPASGMSPMMMDALAQASPTPTVSMSPLPQAKNVEASPPLRKVLDSIMCQCGCGLTVYQCEGTMVCSVSAAMRADAERMLKSGKSSDQVLRTLVADYGEGILSTPVKSGFNLTAWILPFVVLGAGGVLVAFAIRAWRPKAAIQGTSEFTSPTDPEYLARIERELKEEDE